MGSDLGRVLDEARSIAKRRGHASVTPAHILCAMVQLYPDSAKEQDLERAEAILHELPVGTDAPIETDRTRELLARATTISDLADVLAEAVDADVRATPSPESSEQHGRRLPPELERLAAPTEPSAEILGRTEDLDALIAVLTRSEPAIPTLVGKPGEGRTALLHALARRAANALPGDPVAGWIVVVLRADRLLLEKSSALVRGLHDLREREASLRPVVCFDDVEVVTGLGRSSADLGMLSLIRSLAEREELRVVLTLPEEYLPRLEVHDRELKEELVPLRLTQIDTDTIEAIAASAGARLGALHGLTIEDAAIRAATVPPRPSEGRAHPGLAIQRLDVACGRARVRGSTAVTAEDLQVDEDAYDGRELTREELRKRLRARIVGQDEAIETVTSRLSLTRKGVDLDPRRPNGVFLFVGPTGVGKTELARALCSELCGDEQSLIRLDMSEYVEEWSVSRLIGPQPGYVGYTEPEHWLTTRVRANPRAVILLDEIEKAHYLVWNAFLQVFDAGQLTDGRGGVARFSDTVVIMTSNLGHEAYSTRGHVGFTEREARHRSADVVAAVRRTMAPELVNRLDAIVVFEPLQSDAIEEIAAQMVADAVERLREGGYELEVETEVIARLGKEGYDPAFGARHLRRTIESALLEPVVELQPGRYTAALVGDHIEFGAR